LTLRHVTLRIETYVSTLRYGFLRYVTLREGGKHALRNSILGRVFVTAEGLS